MIEKIKQEAMRRGMKLMTNPKVMKMMADPRVMNAISQGFALRGQIQSSIEGTIRTIAKSLNLATKDEMEMVRRSITRVEDSVTDLERKLSD